MEHSGYICDRCGRKMDIHWEIEGMPGTGGNCTSCGDDLCAECGGKWGEDGECEFCAMSLEELEYELPLSVQRREQKKMPCPDCKKIIEDAVNYEQRVYRSDSFGQNGSKSRIYEISYKDRYSDKLLFRTNRYRSYREALIEAHVTLEKMNLHPRHRQRKNKEGKNAD